MKKTFTILILILLLGWTNVMAGITPAPLTPQSSVTTNNATNITATTVTLNGSALTQAGCTMTFYFEYGTTTSYGSSSLVPTPASSYSNISATIYQLTGLSPGTTYHYRIWGNLTGTSSGIFVGGDITFTTLVLPTITSFTPASGAIGSSVTISGTGFNTTAAQNIVFFGATKAVVTAASETSLTVTVPLGATYEYLSVTNLATQLTAYSAKPFIVTLAGSITFISKVDFATGNSPNSIKIGDINGDGKADLVVPNYSSNTVSVFLNTSTLGNVSFAPKVDFTTGARPESVSIGDINGDGKPDLVVANVGSLTVSVFRNTSSSDSLSFATRVDITTGTTSQPVSIGDIDGDGKPDLVVVNLWLNTVSIFRNISLDTTINFETKVDFTTGLMPCSVSIGDINGDGKADLAVGNKGNTISVFRNISSGTTINFATKADFITGITPFSVCIGDINADGKPDLAVANQNSSSVSVFRNTSSSSSVSFEDKVDFATGMWPTGASIGDIDGDGKPDLAVTSSYNNTVSVLRNTSTSGSVSFATKVDFTTGTNPQIVCIGDIDGDGKPDLAVNNYDNNTVSVIRQIIPFPTITSFTPTSAAAGRTVTITGTYFANASAVSFGGTAATSYSVVSSTCITAVVESGATGAISITTPWGTAISAGTFTYIPHPTITSFTPESGAIGSSVTITGTNFNATAAQNIVFFGATKAVVTTASATSLIVTVPFGATYQYLSVTNLATQLTAYSDKPFIVTLAGNVLFTNKVNFTTGTGPQSVSIGDIDGDGKPDLVVPNNTSNTVSVFRNTSNSDTVSFATRVDFTTGSRPESVSIGDIDGDGKPDLVVPNFNSNNISVFRNTSSAGSLSFAIRVDFAISFPEFISIGDIDGDGKPDLAVTSYMDNNVSVLRNTSTSDTVSFAAMVVFETSYPESVSIGDIDGDGKPDLVVPNRFDNLVSVFRNTSLHGSVSFAAKVDFATGSQPVKVSIGDIDGDGKPDLVVADSYWANSSISVLRNISTSGSVSFDYKAYFATGSGPYSVSMGDIDGDGKPDFAVANVFSSTVSVFRNTSTAGSITSGSFADMADFATSTNPSSVIIGDIDGDGKPDLAVINGSNTVSVFRQISPVQVTASLGTATGGYNTLKAAFDSINSGYHKGVITIQIKGSITETASAKLNANGSGSAVYSAVTIYPTVTGLSISGAIDGPLVDLNGADNVSIDGRVNATGTTKELVIANTSTSGIEGTSTIRFIESAENNIIKYCKVKGSAIEQNPAFCGIIYFAASSTGNGNDSDTIDNCDITSSAAGRANYAILSIGSSSRENSGVVISNNNIYDYSNPVYNSHGIYIYSNSSAWKITGNSFYETTSFVPAAGGSYGMVVINSGNNYEITNNFMGGSSANCIGSWEKSAAFSNYFYGIYMNTNELIASSIQGNTIKNINWLNNDSSPWYGFFIQSGSVNIGNITGNTIGSALETASIRVTQGGNLNGDVYGILCQNSTLVNIQNNTIGSFTIGHSNTGYATNFYGITKRGPGNVIISKNIIGSTTEAESINATSISTLNAQNVSGVICESDGSYHIRENIIANLTNANTKIGGTVKGIDYSCSITPSTINGNFIHSLSSSSSNTTIYGICHNGGTSTFTNNIISLGSGLTTGNSFIGFKVNAQGVYTINLYYNTIYIGGSASGTTANTFALSNSGMNTRVYQNNIFSNYRTGGTTGKHYAISVTDKTNLTCDYNDYYVLPSGVLGVFNGTNKPILSDWATSSGGDIHSKNADPIFANIGGSLAENYKPSQPTLLAVSGTGVLTDYDSITRSTTLPSMGAYEILLCTNPTTGGTIASDQTICKGATPTIFTSVSLPTGQTGTLEYQWQRSTDSIDFVNLATGTYTATTYQVDTITVNTWYRRLARVSCMNDWTGADTSNVVKITVRPEFKPGSIEGENSFATIIYTNFSEWKTAAQAGGSSVAHETFDGYTSNAPTISGTTGVYSWLASAIGSLYPGTGNAGYVMSTTLWGDKMTFTFGSGVYFVGGYFFGTDINYNFNISNVKITLNDGTIWEQNVTNSNNFVGFRSSQEIHTLSIDCNADIWPAAGDLYFSSFVSQSICYGGDPSEIGSITAASGGNDTITYEWYKSTTNFTDSTIIGSNTATYDPPTGLTQTTTYRRYAHDGSCNPDFALSGGEFTVTVYDNFTTGTIASMGETICYNGNPAEIGSTLAASGGNDTITYEWYKSTTNFTDSTLISSNTATYDPPAGLTQTTTYRRYAHNGSCNPDFTVSDGEWTVTVSEVFTAGITQGYQTIVQYPFASNTNYDLLSTDVSEAILDFTNLDHYTVADDGYGVVLQSYPTDNTISATDALTNNIYFTLTLNAVKTLYLDSLIFEVGKGGSSDPRGFFIRSSIDGYTNNLFSETLPSGSQLAPSLHKLGLNNSFKGVSNVTFRFYVFTPADNRSVDWRNLKIVYGIQGETICYNGNPVEIGSTLAASGGNDTITYEWYKSTDNFTDSTLIASNTSTYDPPTGLTTTTSYRRYAHDGSCNNSLVPSTGTYVVTVYPDFTSGTIASTGETICYNGNPAIIGSTTAASGGNDTITYEWYKSTTNFTDSTIIGSNTASYDPPTGLTTTTTYRRYAHDGKCNTLFVASAGTWIVTLYDNFSTGEIPSTGETVYYDGNPAIIGSTTDASGGFGVISYQWQRSTTGSASGFADISGATASTYNQEDTITLTTWYRRQAKDEGCNASLTLSAGVWKVTVVNAPSVIVRNNLNIGYGSLRTAIANVANAGTITFITGINGQTITLTTGTLTIDKNITIDNSNHVSGLNPGIRIAGSGTNLTINSGKVLTLASNSKITVSGAIVNNAGTAGLVIESGASFIHNTANLQATAKRYLNNGWHLIGSPFKKVLYTVSNIAPAGGIQIKPYTNGTNWQNNVTSMYTYLLPTTGYAVKPSANYTMSLAGNLYYSTISFDNTVALTYNGSSASQSWNLLANPYTSNIDFKMLTKTNISQSLYIWDNSRYPNITPVTNTTYFNTFNTLTNVGVPVGTTSIIAPMQGFFVKAVYTTPKIVFTPASRTHSNAVFYKSYDTEILLRLKAETEQGADELAICRNESAKQGFEEYDSEKLLNGNPIEIYSYAKTKEKLTINTANANKEIIPLGINAEAGSKVKISSFGMESAENLYLEDRIKGKLISLSENTEYTFIADEKSEYGRFFIRFGNTNSGLTSSDISVTQSGSELSIIAQTGESIEQIEIYTITGARVYSAMESTNVHTVNLNLSKAMYLIRVKTSIETQNLKFNWK